jgi:hypothetical protein
MMMGMEALKGLPALLMVGLLFKTTGRVATLLAAPADAA